MSKETASKHFILFGIVLAALSVILGAFGAHGLKGQIEPSSIESFRTGIRYQMFHALGLILFASMNSVIQSGLGRLGSWAFIIGTVFFLSLIHI